MLQRLAAGATVTARPPPSPPLRPLAALSEASWLPTCYSLPWIPRRINFTSYISESYAFLPFAPQLPSMGLCTLPWGHTLAVPVGGPAAYPAAVQYATLPARLIKLTHCCCLGAANFALCCPSRSTILAGQCAHNTGVVGLGGDLGIFNPLGGFQRFNDRGLEEKTAPYHLQQAGYRTGLIGK